MVQLIRHDELTIQGSPDRSSVFPSPYDLVVSGTLNPSSLTLRPDFTSHLELRLTSSCFILS